MTNDDRTIPMTNDPLIPQDIDSEPMADLENMTVWEHIEFWTELAYQFLWQLQSASVGQLTGNLGVCGGNLTVIYEKGVAIYNEYSNLYIAEAGYSTFNLLRAIDPVINNCYMSAFDYSISFTLYVGTITSWEKMLYNICHNLGNIYDLVEEAIKRSIDWDHNYLKISYWSRMGYIIGRVF